MLCTAVTVHARWVLPVGAIRYRPTCKRHPGYDTTIGYMLEIVCLNCSRESVVGLGVKHLAIVHLVILKQDEDGEGGLTFWLNLAAEEVALSAANLVP